MELTYTFFKKSRLLFLYLIFSGIMSLQLTAQAQTLQSEIEIQAVPFAVIEIVPVYPNCESLDSNEERKQCFSKKMTDFVNENFNENVAKELGLIGVNRLIVQFTINTKGEIQDVLSRAPHPRLEEEAERVLGLLPKMEPGMQRGRPVNVRYSLPIVFQIPTTE